MTEPTRRPHGRPPGLASMPICPACGRRVHFNRPGGGCWWRPRLDGLWAPGCQTTPLRAPRYPDPDYADQLAVMVNALLKRFLERHAPPEDTRPAVVI